MIEQFYKNPKDALAAVFTDEVLEKLDDRWDETIAKDFIPGAKITLVEQVGGEGEGESYHIIWKLEFKKTKELAAKTFYFKRHAYYDSYNGADWSCSLMFLVEPTQVTVTVYKPV